ncbi:MAG TPA: DEAD/DEAH box helicase family protein, partial [Propionibacteriaceae bacterium]|nr:DEAD/DEAH box helicase family protein [Propionibacteriaceae bacterium]
NTQSLSAGIAQYMTDRKPTKSTPLLMPGRCLVHFVVSNQNVAMTTALAGAETRFIPFDKGNNGHAGNAPSETGSPTDYLWREVLVPTRLLRILQSFAMREADGRLVFPRYHQLRAVEKITADVRQRRAGGKYLVWHSAGSGKTKTIAWLAHRLSRLYGADGEKVFDSVLVISDRRVLDDQLRRAVGLLDAAKGYVVGVGEKSGAKSPVLRKALEEGGHIITVTLQSFPEVKKLIDSDAGLSGRNWCVIADEAHSSQTGESALDLRRMLAAGMEPDPDDADQGVSTDDLLLMEDSAVAAASNMTFVALTATPKHRTLRLFGTESGDGRWEAFDTYTMAQAIEEGFILDVLRRYSTYSMFARVRDTMKSKDMVDESAAITKLVRFIRLHPTAIAQKVEIVIEHFRANVAGSLGGTAKAMVVTDSRMAAVRWSLKMNEYLTKMGYSDMRALVAFSGKITDQGQEYTEPGINKVGDTARHFAEHDEAKVLIVADKFQTGFDEPRLCAMYVDKKLAGIAAIQTLSRLNRAFPDKPLPIVLDFANEPADIQEAFKDYYTDAHISQETDANALNILADRIDQAGYYDDQDMQAISETYLTGADGETIQNKLGGPVARWKAALRKAGDNQAARDQVLAFKNDLRSYANAWDFLSQVIDFQSPELHRRAIVARLLERNLHADALIDVVDVSSVQLAGVGVAQKDAEKDYSISSGNTDPLRPPAYSSERGGSGGGAEKVALDEAIDEVNKIFSAAGIPLGSGSSAAWTKAVWGYLTEDEELQAMAAENTPEQLAASPKFKDLVTGAMVTVASDSTAMTEAATADEELSASITEAIARVATVVYGK